MGLWSNLFGKKAAPLVEPHAVECPHTQLVPRWGNAEDMGNGEKVTHYACAACSDQFAPDVARGMRAV